MSIVFPLIRLQKKSKAFFIKWKRGKPHGFPLIRLQKKSKEFGCPMEHAGYKTFPLIRLQKKSKGLASRNLTLTRLYNTKFVGGQKIPVNNHKFLRKHPIPNHLKPIPRKRFVGVNERISISAITLPPQIYISLHLCDLMRSQPKCIDIDSNITHMISHIVLIVISAVLL